MAFKPEQSSQGAAPSPFDEDLVFSPPHLRLNILAPACETLRVAAKLHVPVKPVYLNTRAMQAIMLDGILSPDIAPCARKRPLHIGR